MITVYGATGYTGRLVSELLVARGIEFTIAGRNEQRLQSLKRALTRVARGGANPSIACVPLEDAEGLTRLAARSKVLLSCAGPFARTGPPLVSACLRAGTHYLDVTGEVRFMMDTLARDDEARERRVALVNALGLDVVPSDFAAHLATERLGGLPDAVEVGWTASSAKLSGGTLRSLMGTLREPGLAYIDGSFVAEPIGAGARRFRWSSGGDPVPAGALLDATAHSAPLADLATLPRTTGTRNARAYVLAPALAGLGAKLLSPLARTALGGRALAIAENALPSPGRGPSATERARSRFAVIAEARQGTRSSLALVTGHDIYRLTAHAAIHALVALCNPAFARFGALSPMQAVDPGVWRQLLERLGCKIACTRGA